VIHTRLISYCLATKLTQLKPTSLAYGMNSTYVLRCLQEKFKRLIRIVNQFPCLPHLQAIGGSMSILPGHEKWLFRSCISLSKPIHPACGLCDRVVKGSSSHALEEGFEWQSGYRIVTISPDPLYNLQSYVHNQEGMHISSKLNEGWELPDPK
jgi:hypothetical protein